MSDKMRDFKTVIQGLLDGHARPPEGTVDDMLETVDEMIKFRTIHKDAINAAGNKAMEDDSSLSFEELNEELDRMINAHFYLK